MAGKRYEISERGAQQLEIVAKKLRTSNTDIEAAGKKLSSELESCPALGPHKTQLLQEIYELNLAMKASTTVNEDLAQLIDKIVIRIRTVVAKRRP